MDMLKQTTTIKENKMGLKTIVREELALRGKTWTKKAPQAIPNKREAAKLSIRQRGYETVISNKANNSSAFTMPGSYRK